MKKFSLVLLVDDNKIDTFITKRIIEISGFSEDVVVCNSGKAGLQYLDANKNQPENLPDIIFLDINMPIVDGYVFLHEFEKFSSNVKKKCKIIVLSSSDSRDEIENILRENNVVDFISKPILEQQLFEIQKKWINMEQFSMDS